MGLLDPSEDDQNESKKPRFLQDSIAFIIMALVGIIAIVVALLTA